MRAQYTIEFYMEPPVDRWLPITGFQCMNKSFADGAWAMLRAFNNHRYRHRLVKNGEVVAEMTKQIVRPA